MESNDPLISIIIPTYNEEEDIAKCLDAALALDYPNKEIIVVDSASTDRTPQILAGFAARGQIRLLTEPERRGVSSARNYGLKEAKGEIVVILNADVILQRDFLRQIMQHYRNGADFVVCESAVLNQDNLVSLYIQAEHILDYSQRDDLVWSEGFSARRAALLDVGGFPSFPQATAGEDAALGYALARKYRGVVDHSILVPHITYSKLWPFLKSRYGRGRGVALFQRHHLRRSPVPKNLAYLAGGIGLLLWLVVEPRTGALAWAAAVAVFSLFSLWRGFRLAWARPSTRHLVLPFAALTFLAFAFQKAGTIRESLRRSKPVGEL